MFQMRKKNILPLFTQDIIYPENTYFYLYLIFFISMLGLLILLYFHNKIELFIYMNIVVVLVGVIIYNLRFQKPTHLSF